MGEFLYSVCKFIFYAFGIFALMYELIVLTYTRNVIEYKIKLFIKIKSKGTLPLSKRDLSFMFCMTLYFIWGMAGLMSSQGLLFLDLFILSWIFSIKFLRFNIISNIIDSFLSLTLIIFAMLNTYIFHINLPKSIADLLF